MFRIESPARSDRIREMVTLIERGCHTMNTIRSPVLVSARVVHNGAEVEVSS